MIEEEETTALIFRVAEWATWLPVQKDPAFDRLQVVSGETGLELKPGERLSDLEVVPIEGTLKHMPVPATDSEPAFNMPVKCVVFRATLARAVSGPLPEPPEENLASKLITPENRHQRRRKN